MALVTRGFGDVAFVHWRGVVPPLHTRLHSARPDPHAIRRSTSMIEIDSHLVCACDACSVSAQSSVYPYVYNSEVFHNLVFTNVIGESLQLQFRHQRRLAAVSILPVS